MPEILTRIIRYLDFFAFFIPVFSEIVGRQNNTFLTGAKRLGKPDAAKIARKKFFIKITQFA